MQEIYTMIMNNGVTLVIVVIFLYQYIINNFKKNESKDEPEHDVSKDLMDNNFILSVINRLDKIIVLLEELLKKNNL